MLIPLSSISSEPAWMAGCPSWQRHSGTAELAYGPAQPHALSLSETSLGNAQGHERAWVSRGKASRGTGSGEGSALQSCLGWQLGGGVVVESQRALGKPLGGVLGAGLTPSTWAR